MANKILTSDQNGKYKEVPNTSASVDITVLSASNLVMNTASYGNNTGILYVTGSQITNLRSGSVTGGALQYRSDSGYVAQVLPTVASFTGDITGAIGSQVKILSAQNVNTGSLSQSYGGLGYSAYGNPSVLMKFETLTCSVDPTRTLTLTSPAVTSSAQAKFGTKSLAPTSTGSRTTTTILPDLNNDFTVEAWIYPITTGSSNSSGFRMGILDYRDNANSTNKFLTGIGTNGSICYYPSSGVVTTSSLTVQTGSWNHVAFVRKSSIVRFYVNGNQDINTRIHSSFIFGGTGSIGCSGFTGGSEPNFYFNGYIDELAIHDYAKYTGSFTTSSLEVQPASNNYILTGSLVTLGPSRPRYSQIQTSSMVATPLSSNSWITLTSGAVPYITGTLAYLYTGSLSATTAASQTTFTWTKPTGCRFVRVIVQGAGGGGGGATSAGDGGTGGGGGGYSEATFNAFGLENQITCLVGNGGLRGVGSTVGGAGGDSSFGNYLYAYGGTGGRADTLQSNAGTGTDIEGKGGIGYYNGANGGNAFNGNAETGLSAVRGGAGGGGGGGTRAISFGGNGGAVTDYPANGGLGGVSNSADGGDPTGVFLFKFSNYFLNNISSVGFPALIYGGGGGGASDGNTGSPSGNGGTPYFASGGGGGGIGPTTSNGGYGGRGYILVICY